MSTGPIHPGAPNLSHRPVGRWTPFLILLLAVAFRLSASWYEPHPTLDEVLLFLLLVPGSWIIASFSLLPGWAFTAYGAIAAVLYLFIDSFGTSIDSADSVSDYLEIAVAFGVFAVVGSVISRGVAFLARPAGGEGLSEAQPRRTSARFFVPRPKFCGYLSLVMAGITVAWLCFLTLTALYDNPWAGNSPYWYAMLANCMWPGAIGLALAVAGLFQERRGRKPSVLAILVILLAYIVLPMNFNFA